LNPNALTATKLPTLAKLAVQSSRRIDDESAFIQYRQPYAWHEPYSYRSEAFWLHPLEWNLDAGLPEITGNINAVALTPDGQCLSIAGCGAARL
jgi:hypothetical protein